MRKSLIFLLFLIVSFICSSAPADSTKARQCKVSLTVNAIGGSVSPKRYDVGYNSGLIHQLPFEIRCIFIKNRLGIIYSSFGHSGSNYYPFKSSNELYPWKAKRVLYVAYNISPTSFNFKRGALYIQIGHGMATRKDRYNGREVMFLLSTGGIIKINSGVGLNISGTITHDLINYKDFYKTLYASAGLRFQLYDKDSVANSSAKKSGFFAELGGDFNSVKRHELISGDGQYYAAYNIDTSHIIRTDLGLNQTFTPLIVLGYKLKKHSLAVEGIYLNSEFRSVYTTPNINFSQANIKSKNLKVAFEYNYVFPFIKWKKIKQEKYCFFAGIKIKQEFRNNKIEMDYAREFRDDEMLRSEFKSSITRFLPVLGLKIKCNERLYIKSGLDINSLGYITGLYEWEKTIIPDFWPKTYAEGEKAYNKTLYGGENSSFALIDNFFLRIGYSF